MEEGSTEGVKKKERKEDHKRGKEERAEKGDRRTENKEYMSENI